MKTLAATIVLTFACAFAHAALPEFITLSPDGKSFIYASSKKPFTPWGFNYDRDFRLRLIEDYWLGDWDTIVSDFREMKALGANVVRIHLQFGKFMNSPVEPDERNLIRLQRLVSMAEEVGLYLDLTGLGSYRKQDCPKWYDELTEEQRWAAQARFWEAIAARLAFHPGVFCYDLINEPVVPGEVRKPGEWLHEHAIAGFQYVQFIALDPAGRERSEIARKWTKQMVAAIRKQDRRHLITIGLLPNSLDRPGITSGFDPTKIAPELDFISVHLYPRSGKLEEDIDTLRGFNIGKPVVIEEIFPLTCDNKELAQFIDRSRIHARGWIGFYWGQQPRELRASTRPVDGMMRAWLETFQQLKPD